MSDARPTPDSREEVFGHFYEEPEGSADREAVVRRYAAEHPRWAADFRAEAAIELLVHAPPVPGEPFPAELPDFHIVREVARGGMGVVYETEQRSLRRRVALKVRRLRLSPEAQRRFEREQETLAKLHQTHIVPVHTAGQVRPWQYFAMAYIEGAPLHRLVKTAWLSTLLPYAEFRLEFFVNSDSDPSGYGEGMVYLGTSQVWTDENGQGYFQEGFTHSVPPGYCISATATDPDGTTWEFSNCVVVEAGSGPGTGGSSGDFVRLLVHDRPAAWVLAGEVRLTPEESKRAGVSPLDFVHAIEREESIVRDAGRAWTPGGSNAVELDEIVLARLGG